MGLKRKDQEKLRQLAGARDAACAVSKSVNAAIEALAYGGPTDNIVYDIGRAENQINTLRAHLARLRDIIKAEEAAKPPAENQ